MGKTLVGIVVGSKSDLPVIEKAKQTLDELDVGSELEVMSAHRDPERVAVYAESAEDRGLEVIICGAGMAAHLAGAIAARTVLPVIGVPIESGSLKGIDSLLSTVMMPTGVPVATVAVNGAKNAAILAAQIVANKHSDVRIKLKKLKK